MASFERPFAASSDDANSFVPSSAAECDEPKTETNLTVDSSAGGCDEVTNASSATAFVAGSNESDNSFAF
jgi:hypothetical protein